MSITDIKNRRAHRRVQTSFEIEGKPEDGSIVARMVTRNLSLGGLYCTSSTDFPEMTRLAVRLVLSPDEGSGTQNGESVEVEAVVVRREKLSTEGANGERYRLGLYFTRLEDDARRQIERYLDQGR